MYRYFYYVDIKTGLSIYNRQWLVEPNAAVQMLDYWEKIKANNESWNYRKSKEESAESPRQTLHQKFLSREGIVMAPDNVWDMEDFKGFEGATVAVIPVTGPLMKSDFCGSFGTKSLAGITQMASNTTSVQAIVFLHDSPGGTVDGTQSFADAVKASTKRTITLCEGMMCSADYWVGSSSDEVYASSETDIIGSIGTMISFYDYSKAIEKEGIILRQYYATESKDKNKATTDAMNGDGKALVSEMLDPINDIFLSAVKDNRGAKLSLSKENVLTGKVYTSPKAVTLGLIDGIASFDEVMSSAASGMPVQLKTTRTRTITTKSNTVMTAAEFKAAHPAAHAEIVQEAATAERDRVGSWMAFAEVDPTAVKAGIESGSGISQTQMSEFALKAHSKKAIADVQADGAPAIKTSEIKPEDIAAKASVDAFTAEVKANLKKAIN